MDREERIVYVKKDNDFIKADPEIIENANNIVNNKTPIMQNKLYNDSLLTFSISKGHFFYFVTIFLWAASIFAVYYYMDLHFQAIIAQYDEKISVLMQEIEALKATKSHTPFIPIIMSSGYTPEYYGFVLKMILIGVGVLVVAPAAYYGAIWIGSALDETVIGQVLDGINYCVLKVINIRQATGDVGQYLWNYGQYAGQAIYHWWITRPAPITGSTPTEEPIPPISPDEAIYDVSFWLHLPLSPELRMLVRVISQHNLIIDVLIDPALSGNFVPLALYLAQLITQDPTAAAAIAGRLAIRVSSLIPENNAVEVAPPLLAPAAPVNPEVEREELTGLAALNMVLFNNTEFVDTH